ncbi:MAG: RNA 2',3'-cyclic phosphodiesterase [Eggerthellaceae bacterium]|jgi:2'-5' RNA ligase
MMEKRLFIALTCSDAEREGLARNQAALLSRVRKAAPTAKGNLHLTLAFLGMRDEEGEQAATEAVAAAAAVCEPVRLALGPLGAFHRRHGSIVWRGVAANPQLDRLQHTIVRELSRRDIELEARPFVAHLTLARNVRMNQGDDLDVICAELSQGLPTDLSASQADATAKSAGDAPAGGSGPAADDAAAGPRGGAAEVPGNDTTAEPKGPVPAAPAGLLPLATLHTDVSLMWSHHPASGELTYTPLATFELGKRADGTR